MSTVDHGNKCACQGCAERLRRRVAELEAKNARLEELRVSACAEGVRMVMHVQSERDEARVSTLAWERACNDQIELVMKLGAQLDRTRADERAACIEIIRKYLAFDSQRAVSYGEVRDAIEAIEARGKK